jgi:hypothetical protein
MGEPKESSLPIPFIVSPKLYPNPSEIGGELGKRGSKKEGAKKEEAKKDGSEEGGSKKWGRKWNGAGMERSDNVACALLRRTSEVPWHNIQQESGRVTAPNPK